MRALTLLTIAAAVAAPLAAQGRPADPDNKVAGGGSLPAGWSARLDQSAASIADVKFVAMGPGLHATTGPAVILWRATDGVSGSFHTLATFTQTKAPTHPEAYGLIVGGKDLAGAEQSYIYFIVRGDGQFSIRQRKGDVVTNLSAGNRNGWAASDAMVKADSTTGAATNKLEIDGKIDPSKVSFKVNGKVVLELKASDVNLDGFVGLRINHNLDVHVADFAVHRM
jgi:hypothetical protein